jgi:hypothetical protein
MARRLGYAVPQVELHQKGSEVFHPEAGSISLCMTSFPYFDTERYSDESTQSCIKFPTKEKWLHGYLGETLNNCHIALRPEGKLVVNIADAKSYKWLQNDLVALAEASGWFLEDTLRLQLSRMPGTGKSNQTHKLEPIYVFHKLEHVHAKW